MTGSYSFIFAIIMGFTGSLHCAGMCGPIIWVMPFQFLSGFKKWLGILLYHMGRITAYALLALALHSVRGLFRPEVQQYFSITVGVLLLLTGLLSFFPNAVLNVNLPWGRYIKTRLALFLSKPGIPALLSAGFFNGLLPCGLVYMALSASVSISSTWQSVGFMYAFGLGTLPTLVSITLLKNRTSIWGLKHVKRAIPLIAFSFGCLFVLRGMNLGIPYLSPKIEITQQVIKSSCCHK